MNSPTSRTETKRYGRAGWNFTMDKSFMRSPISAALLVLVLLLSACSQRQRPIAGDYRLEQWEDLKTYYLHKRGQDDSSQGGSLIGGTVVRIGWNDRYIVAERHSIYRGDSDGWMIIDIQSGKMIGPFGEADFQAHPEAQGIPIYDVSDAWKKL